MAECFVGFGLVVDFVAGKLGILALAARYFRSYAFNHYLLA
jgi:hypothetical protein